MKKSDVAFKVANAFPPITDLFMQVVAPRLPPHWILSHIATERNLRIPVSARLSNGMKIKVILGDGVGEAIRRHGCYEPETASVAVSQLRRDSIFFDLGAHVGQYTLLASRLCHSVHSFEALPDTFTLLRDNIRSNGLANVRAENVAVSDKCGKLTIYEGPSDNLGTSSLAPARGGQRAFSVSAISIDRYCAAHDVLPDVMKIDVEGAEIAVLRGASDVLREKRPALLVEIADVNQRQFGFSSDQLIDELKGFGYSLSRIEDPFVKERDFYNVLATMPGNDLGSGGSGAPRL